MMKKRNSNFFRKKLYFSKNRNVRHTHTHTPAPLSMGKFLFYSPEGEVEMGIFFQHQKKEISRKGENYLYETKFLPQGPGDIPRVETIIEAECGMTSEHGGDEDDFLQKFFALFPERPGGKFGAHQYIEENIGAVEVERMQRRQVHDELPSQSVLGNHRVRVMAFVKVGKTSKIIGLMHGRRAQRFIAFQETINDPMNIPQFRRKQTMHQKVDEIQSFKSLQSARPR
jgi:hypothetical protein